MTGSKSSKRHHRKGGSKHRKHHKKGGSLWDAAKETKALSKVGSTLGGVLPGPYGQIAQGVGALAGLFGLGRKRSYHHHDHHHDHHRRGGSLIST